MVWEYRDNRIFGSLSNDDEELYDICERVETCKKTVNLLTGEESIDILLYTEYDVKPITLSRDEISEKEIITTLTKYGLTLPEDEGCATLLKSVITDTEKTAPIEYFHKEVGFIKFRGNFCFLGHSPIGKFNEHQRH